ncbi:sigma-70 family RNA polymerase sigma factor [Aurantibacter crassamenti]|uniref:RNA polymerase sigma factor n=1 Tax=Aurantibacter crassamenti TaxID=1837375 RepID=UPI00193ABBAE|nr:sigma-70 family RNA polymerase sigma factor [Aurantibacter crassamenti]MBM1107937.1 sigma-70 family RNA polymerase sigma factor [Aurantibacter crassamenti]
MSIETDQFYIDAVLNGDTKAFAVLVNRYRNMVFTLTVQLLKNREEAEEIAQDTFVKIYKNLNTFNGDSKFSTWVYRIAYNACLDRIKKNKKHETTISINEYNESQINSLETAFDIMDRTDREQAIKSCLQKLPEDDSVLITLFYFEELSLTEISKVIGISANNVKIKLYRARKRLATILEKSLEPTILENYGPKSR